MTLPDKVYQSYCEHFTRVRSAPGPRLHALLDHHGEMTRELWHLLNRVLDWRNHYGPKLLTTDLFVRAFWEVRGEAQNGGFHQYFANSAGDDWPTLLRMLELGNAERERDHFRQVLSIFPNSAPSVNRDERNEQLEMLEREDQSKVDQHFAKLNAEYYGDCFYPDDNTIFSALRQLDDEEVVPDP